MFCSFPLFFLIPSMTSQHLYLPKSFNFPTHLQMFDRECTKFQFCLWIPKWGISSATFCIFGRKVWSRSRAALFRTAQFRTVQYGAERFSAVLIPSPSRLDSSWSWWSDALSLWLLQERPHASVRRSCIPGIRRLRQFSHDRNSHLSGNAKTCRRRHCVYRNGTYKKSELMLMRRATASVQFRTQVFLVYLQYISAKIHSKCASRPKIAKNH